MKSPAVGGGVRVTLAAVVVGHEIRSGHPGDRIVAGRHLILVDEIE